MANLTEEQRELLLWLQSESIFNVTGYGPTLLELECTFSDWDQEKIMRILNELIEGQFIRVDGTETSAIPICYTYVRGL